METGQRLVTRHLTSKAKRPKTHGFEAENLCDRLAIVDYGKIAALGTPNRA
ncbi:MAG: hypothetical protein ABSD49_05925 [Candidatus Bathyarchaeia archaeon]